MDENFDRELKAALLDMMDWFHDFCGKHGIRYYMLGGTMLGAARHRGFIPWDDDIDVGVVSEDYRRLGALLAQSGQTRYVYESPETGAKDYCYPFSKLYDTATTLVENKRHAVKRGIYLDIFPLIGLGDTEEESRKRFAPIDRETMLLLARTAGIRKGRSPLKNAAAYAARCLPGSASRTLLHLHQTACSLDFCASAYGGNPFGAWRGREIMETSVMGTPTLYPFEHLRLYGAENADAYLTHLYGDWRQLPPEEKRVTHHDYLACDLHRSYLE